MTGISYTTLEFTQQPIMSKFNMVGVMPAPLQMNSTDQATTLQ